MTKDEIIRMAREAGFADLNAGWGSEQQAETPKRPWVDLTDEDWEWVADKKETSLDTFAHGAAWAADRLKERNI